MKLPPTLRFVLTGPTISVLVSRQLGTERGGGGRERDRDRDRGEGGRERERERERERVRE